MNRPVPINAAAAAAAEEADRTQAEYYLRLLTEVCFELDRRIAKHQAALGRLPAQHNREEAHRLRRLVRFDQHERDEIDQLIAALHRRFKSLMWTGATPQTSA